MLYCCWLDLLLLLQECWISCCCSLQDLVINLRCCFSSHGDDRGCSAELIQPGMMLMICCSTRSCCFVQPLQTFTRALAWKWRSQKYICSMIVSWWNERCKDCAITRALTWDNLRSIFVVFWLIGMCFDNFHLFTVLIEIIVSNCGSWNLGRC